MTTDDQQPTDASEPEPGTTTTPASEDAPSGEPGPAAGPREADDQPDQEEDAARFRALPVAEQLRLLREQFEDPDWRSTRKRITILRTIEEDPIGYPYLATAFPEVSRGERELDRSWAHAQAALDATELGRVARPTLELLPAGREFRVAMRIPELGGTATLTTRGWRTPNGAMRNAERAFVRLVIEEGAPVLAARQAAEREQGSAADADEPTAGAGDDASADPAVEPQDPA